MLNYKLKKYKNKWMKQYKKDVIDKSKEYYNAELNDINDFNSKMSIYCLTYYDSVNNEELNKMIRKLYKAKNKNYDIDIVYKENRIGKMNYIKTEFDSTGHGGLAKIRFLNDELISTIDIMWTQINNDEAVLEYTCYLKKQIYSFSDIHNYVENNYNKLKKIKYSTFCNNISFFVDDDRNKYSLEFEYFKVLLQNKISAFIVSHYIKKYLLPIKCTYLIEHKTKKIVEYLKNPFLEKTYILDKKHYIVTSHNEEYQGTTYNEFIFGNTINIYSFMDILSRIRMPLYYEMFYQIEKNELSYKITNYLNSKRFKILLVDYRWLLNKRRRIGEKKFYHMDNNNQIELKGYLNEKDKFVDLELCDRFKDVYDDNIEFIKNFNVLNYNLITFIISILALIVGIVALFQSKNNNNINGYECSQLIHNLPSIDKSQ